ncbi:hypothetical protein EDC01DRAFT_788219 [Geopyxis carbonaria]|nr:hypothetical protein EDC01DRAFT_788219 [Geopyxis carbonaria]
MCLLKMCLHLSWVTMALSASILVYGIIYPVDDADEAGKDQDGRRIYKLLDATVLNMGIILLYNMLLCFKLGNWWEKREMRRNPSYFTTTSQSTTPQPYNSSTMFFKKITLILTVLAVFGTTVNIINAFLAVGNGRYAADLVKDENGRRTYRFLDCTVFLVGTVQIFNIMLLGFKLGSWWQKREMRQNPDKYITTFSDEKDAQASCE